jgi:glycosyltransferase involved in cell wall biosynthesis
MRIAVNTRLLIKNRLDGIGWYAYHTLQRIVKMRPSDEFIFLFDRPFDREFIFSANVTPMVIPPPTRHPLLWYAWLECSLPLAFRRLKPDIFLSPDGFLSLHSIVPSLAVIHDLNFHHRPQDLPFSSRFFYNRYFPLYAKKAERIVTVSEYSKADLVNSYHVPASKIDVTYNGAHSLYKPLAYEQKKEVQLAWSNGMEYFLFVGSLHPRKNVEHLLLAFDIFKKQTGNTIKLLIVGDRFFKTRSLQTTFDSLTFRQDVVFTGRLEPGDLAGVMGAALALTFVPLFEGFGIPLVEAMYCDVPIIASNVTAVPEVAGDTALYADPQDIHTIARAMARIVNEPMVREQLVANCSIRRQQFNWDNTAKGLSLALDKVLA